MASKIQIRVGIGHPGTVLDTAEPAFDTSANTFYIGASVGGAPTAFYNAEYVDGSLSNVSGANISYVDGSLALRDIEITQHDASIVRLDAYNITQDTSAYNESLAVDASFNQLYVLMLDVANGGQNYSIVNDDSFDGGNGWATANTEVVSGGEYWDI